MKLKKIVSLVLVCILAVSLLSGCGEEKIESTLNLDPAEFSETNGVKLPITEKGEIIEIMTNGSVEGLDNKLFAQAVKELTGIELKITVVPASNYASKLQMMLSSKQLPDIFDCTLNRSDLEMLAKNGALVNFSKMGKELPNISEVFLNNEENMKLAANLVVDGDLFVVPGYNIARDINHGFMYRKDIFDKHGIKLWTNTEEFYQALKKLKEIYPDSVPFTSKNKDGLIGRLAPGWGFSDVKVTKYKGEGDYIYAGTHAEMKSLLDFLQKLYSERLLDQEFLTCTDASWSSKMTQEAKSFVTFDWVDRMDLFYEQIKETNPNYNLSFGNPIGPVGKYTRLSKVGAASLAVSNNDKAEISAKLVDFLMSPAGAKLATLGIKGTTYDEVDGKVQYKLPEGKLANINTLQEEYGLFTQSIALRFDPTCVYYQFTPHVQEAQNMVINNNLLTETAPAPIVIKSELVDEYNSISNELSTKFSEFASKYIVADSASLDGMWNAWVAQANQLGAERIVEIANTK